MKTEIYQYNNNPVSFQLEGNGDIMISASQMAKPFGKLPADWLRTKQSKEFLDAKATMGNHIVTDLVVVINGGDGRGTFMHEDVALEFARWLSPQFAIWCNAKIKELLRVCLKIFDLKY